MRSHYVELTGTDTYEIEMRGDIYGTLIVAADPGCTGYIEVSNGNNVWVDAPTSTLFAGNPFTDAAVWEFTSTWGKVRLRLTANAGGVAFNYCALEADL